MNRPDPTPLPPPTTGWQRLLPALSWRRDFKRETATKDLSAGLTTAVMLIPQAMAYAMLAGLPPIVGLYASMIPLVLYAVLGTSRQLAVGPVAMVSLLVAQGISPLAETGSAHYVALAVVLALMVGVVQFVMGSLRLGFLVNFLSHPVVSGFTSAAALIIGLSQLKHILGIDIPRSKNIAIILRDAAISVGDWNWLTIAIAVASIAVLIVLKRWKPAFPRALAVVVLGSLVVWLGGLGETVAIVGTIPGGLPMPAMPDINGGDIAKLAPTAITISLVSFMESISVAKAFARKNRYAIDPNQELIGLGAANIGGAFFGAYPVTGGFSRTAVNAQAGAKTTFAGLITAVAIALTLLFLTPLFYYLPKAVLAAIIMTAVFGLVDVKEVKHLLKVKKSDLVLLGLTFVSTLVIGIEEGIAVGVAASLLLFVFRTTRPYIAVLGRVPGTSTFRNVERHSDVQPVPGLLIVRFDAQLYFGNLSFLRDGLARLERAQRQVPHSIILDASGINQIDASGADALAEWHETYEARGIALYLANLKGPVRDVLSRTPLYEALGEGLDRLTVQDAVVRAQSRQTSVE